MNIAPHLLPLSGACEYRDAHDKPCEYSSALYLVIDDKRKQYCQMHAAEKLLEARAAFIAQVELVDCAQCEGCGRINMIFGDVDCQGCFGLGKVMPKKG